jgi:hypothetical protein
VAPLVPVTNPELIERVRELRQRGRTPKEIARTLGLPPSAVAPLIRAVAAAQPAREAALVGCWVNRNWAAGLTVTGHADWPGVGATAESGESGLVSILVARDKGSSVSVCGYLVDVWCLGVKNALGPKSVDRRKLPGFTDWYFRSYDEPPLAVPIDLARHVVFGAIEYAHELGFEPHPDFAGCTSHLGPWEGRSDITFGREGKPMYIQGPHDDAASITRTLRRSVGDDNFHYICQIADSGTAP